MVKVKKKELTREEQELFNELKKLSKRANQRIVRLEREFGKDTWATKYLKEKLGAKPLQAWSKKGRIKANKSMSSVQMKATIKATKEFLNSSISTKRGVKKAKQKAIKTLKIRFSSYVSEISYQEAEALSMFFDDKEVNGITNFIPGSDVLAVIEEAREQNANYLTFRIQMESIVRCNKGTQLENILKKIYVKYIYKGNQDSDEFEILYGTILELITNATSENDLQEVESIISNLRSEGKLEIKEYNYLINSINDKRKEL